MTLQDANGNPSPNKLVNLSQGNGSSTITATTASTDATGKIQFTAINSIAQTVTYTAFDVTDGNLPVPGSAVVNFVNASGFCAGTNSYRVGTTAPGYAVTTLPAAFRWIALPASDQSAWRLTPAAICWWEILRISASTSSGLRVELPGRRQR